MVPLYCGAGFQAGPGDGLDDLDDLGSPEHPLQTI